MKEGETYDLSSSSNHTQASRSKWLVGSSSSSMKGLMNKALQRRQTAVRFKFMGKLVLTHDHSNKCCERRVWLLLNGTVLRLYLARATRILHPPLKSFSFFCCISAVNPKPWRIREARISALSASSSSRRSYSSISFSHSAVQK